ncbi:uncharacterized protein LOC131952898 [Physella acuta]|uniref:uncharacterized protein LOC131952898 n=1 Tax=Physella acuta TaxID=109671 RepID=UPI0027DD8BEB|nr:uncharacterized protein LOC131952898 [Physella acuta]XP_059171815.1 uncharacterized protein LOC131952898 [Physella acuta]XP_059171816.1 uncharacterized protein LOC131952898 [Physella acuta]
MPFSFFRKNKKMLKDKSKSTMDLPHNFSQPPDVVVAKREDNVGSLSDLRQEKPVTQPDLVTIMTKIHKNKSKSLQRLDKSQKSKSLWSLFDSKDKNNNSKSNEHSLSFKEKVRMSAPFRKNSSSSSKSDSSSSNKKSNKSDDEPMVNNNVTPPRHRSSRKRPLGSSNENLTPGMDKRQSYINQLDAYIEYLKREDNNTPNIYNRLCCAQFLRTCLLRQQILINRSNERLDNAQHSPQSASPQLVRSFSIRSSSRRLGAPAGNTAPRGEICDNGVLTHVDSDEAFVGRALSSSTFSLCTNSSDKDLELNSDSPQDSDDNTSCGQSQSKSSNQRFTMSVFPQDIEIY